MQTHFYVCTDGNGGYGVEGYTVGITVPKDASDPEGPQRVVRFNGRCITFTPSTLTKEQAEAHMEHLVKAQDIVSHYTTPQELARMDTWCKAHPNAKHAEIFARFKTQCGTPWIVNGKETQWTSDRETFNSLVRIEQQRKEHGQHTIGTMCPACASKTADLELFP